MKTKNLFIVRHGQTDYNKRKMVQGSGIDAPLNEEGKRQAENFYDAFKDYPFDKIYVSSLLRTKQSVEKFIADGIPYDRLSGLNEISWGDQEGKPFDEASHENYLQITKAWQQGDYEQRVGGGETPIEVMNRQKEAFQHILRNIAEKEVLICMHGRAMRILLCWLLNYPLKNMDYFTHDNLCYYQLNFRESSFAVRLFDEQGHLI